MLSLREIHRLSLVMLAAGGLSLVSNRGEAKPNVDLGEGGSVWIETVASGANGFVVNADGYVVSNKHVVRGCPIVTVTFCGDPFQYPASVVDTSSSCDLSIIMLNSLPPGRPRLKPVILADSLTEIQRREMVILKPADRGGVCHNEMVGWVRSISDTLMEIQATTLFSGHSGTPVISSKTGLTVGCLFSAGAAIPAPSGEKYMLPPYRVIPAPVIRSFLRENGIGYLEGHPPVPRGKVRTAVDIALGCLVLSASAKSWREHEDAETDYQLYRSATDPDVIRMLRTSVQSHQASARAWGVVGVAAGSALLWELRVPQKVWGVLGKLKRSLE